MVLRRRGILAVGLLLRQRSRRRRPVCDVSSSSMPSVGCVPLVVHSTVTAWPNGCSQRMMFSTGVANCRIAGIGSGVTGLGRESSLVGEISVGTGIDSCGGRVTSVVMRESLYTEIAAIRFSVLPSMTGTAVELVTAVAHS